MNNPQESDLEKRLREILPNAHYGGQEDDGWEEEELDEAITEVMAAIKDAGYQKYTTYTKITTADGVVAVQRGLTVMTGAEWYARFEKEAPMSTEPHVFEAARRAAGIDER